MGKDRQVGPREVEVGYTKSALRMKRGMSAKVLPIIDLLEQDFRETGGMPYDRGWASLGSVRLKTGETASHCHLTRKLVAVWTRIEEKFKIACKFIYIGSREKAPY